MTPLPLNPHPPLIPRTTSWTSPTTSAWPARCSTSRRRRQTRAAEAHCAPCLLTLGAARRLYLVEEGWLRQICLPEAYDDSLVSGWTDLCFTKGGLARANKITIWRPRLTAPHHNVFLHLELQAPGQNPSSKLSSSMDSRRLRCPSTRSWPCIGFGSLSCVNPAGAHSRSSVCRCERSKRSLECTEGPLSLHPDPRCPAAPRQPVCLQFVLLSTVQLWRSNESTHCPLSLFFFTPFHPSSSRVATRAHLGNHRGLQRVRQRHMLLQAQLLRARLQGQARCSQGGLHLQ